MKKPALLLICGALSLCACNSIFDFEGPSKDSGLTGTRLDVSQISKGIKKVFVLNEGGMGSNNATLDFLRMSDGMYVNSAFRKMNPDAGAGLGDVGNDIAVKGDDLWIVVNNSGIVEVLSAKDESEIAAVAVPTPRNIAFDDKYAYVTSWAGAYANYGSDYSITDFKNPKGQVYRIDLKTKKVTATVEVGYQPEGIAFYDGKLYVANSGGIASSLPPAYAYDKTVSIINTSTFSVEKTVEVAVNLKNVYSDGKGAVYVSSLGNYFDVGTAMYVLFAKDPEKVYRIGENTVIMPESLHVTCSCFAGGAVYCIGTEDEFNWAATSRKYNIWSCKIDDYNSGKSTISHYPLELEGTPYGMAVIPGSSSASDALHYLLLCDAGDYFNPGTVSCYALDFNNGEKYWTVTAGVCPGHVAVW